MRFVLRLGAPWLPRGLLRGLGASAGWVWEWYTQTLLEELTTHFFEVYTYNWYGM